MAKKKKVAKTKTKSNVSIVSLVEGLQEPVADLTEDAAKFDAGNASAATRLRVGLQAIIAQMKTIRVEVLEQKKKAKEAKKVKKKDKKKAKK